MNNQVILQAGKHFTVTGLLKYLNKNFAAIIPIQKKFSFNINDVHQYIRKEKLPDYCGDIKLKRYYNEQMDLIYIEVVKNT